jgi:hypothetical protein
MTRVPVLRPDRQQLTQRKGGRKVRRERQSTLNCLVAKVKGWVEPNSNPEEPTFHWSVLWTNEFVSRTRQRSHLQVERRSACNRQWWWSSRSRRGVLSRSGSRRPGRADIRRALRFHSGQLAAVDFGVRDWRSGYRVGHVLLERTGVAALSHAVAAGPRAARLVTRHGTGSALT